MHKQTNKKQTLPEILEERLASVLTAETGGSRSKQLNNKAFIFQEAKMFYKDIINQLSTRSPKQRYIEHVFDAAPLIFKEELNAHKDLDLFSLENCFVAFLIGRTAKRVICSIVEETRYSNILDIALQIGDGRNDAHLDIFFTSRALNVILQKFIKEKHENRSGKQLVESLQCDIFKLQVNKARKLANFIDIPAIYDYGFKECQQLDTPKTEHTAPQFPKVDTQSALPLNGTTAAFCGMQTFQNPYFESFVDFEPNQFDLNSLTGSQQSKSILEASEKQRDIFAKDYTSHELYNHRLSSPSAVDQPWFENPHLGTIVELSYCGSDIIPLLSSGVCQQASWENEIIACDLNSDSGCIQSPLNSSPFSGFLQ